MSAKPTTPSSTVGQAPPKTDHDQEPQNKRPSLRVVIPRSHSGKTIPPPQRRPALVRRLRARPDLEIKIPRNFEEGRYTIARDPIQLGGTKLIPTEQELANQQRGYAKEPVEKGDQTNDDPQSARSSPMENCDTCMARSRPTSYSPAPRPLMPWTTSIADRANGDPQTMRELERERWITSLQLSGQEGAHDYLHLYSHDIDSPIDWENGLCWCIWKRQGRFADVPDHCMSRRERDDAGSDMEISDGESADQKEGNVREQTERGVPLHRLRPSRNRAGESRSENRGESRYAGRRTPAPSKSARNKSITKSDSSDFPLSPPADLLVETVEDRLQNGQRDASSSSYASSSEGDSSGSVYDLSMGIVDLRNPHYAGAGPIFDLSTGVVDLRSPRYNQTYLNGTDLANDDEECAAGSEDDLHFTLSELGVRASQRAAAARQQDGRSDRALFDAEEGRRSQDSQVFDFQLPRIFDSPLSHNLRRLLSRDCALILLCILVSIADIMIMVVIVLMIKNLRDPGR
ncbi:hypothetical protein LIA77_00628 [Sarocladium implicatum]|nr:hypothetical protein LIA77_00628 [Sarocladium implicatum]